MPMHIASMPVCSTSALPIDHLSHDAAAVASLLIVEVISLEIFACAMLNMLTFWTLEITLDVFARLQLSKLPGADVH